MTDTPTKTMRQRLAADAQPRMYRCLRYKCGHEGDQVRIAGGWPEWKCGRCGGYVTPKAEQ